MASEPLFEERSDAIKMSETPYPTNGSSKNLAKDTGINILTCVRKHAPIASQARHFPPYAGEADTKEESNQVLYLYTHLCVSLAGFFAKSYMMFFLLSSFRFCPPLKNDGRGAFGFSTIF